jgi:hypothetical protein
MKLSKCLSVVLLGLGCAVAARGQAGVYVGFQATRLSGITCLTAVVTPAQPLQCGSGSNGAVLTSTGSVLIAAQNGAVNPQGFQAGAYYDFRNIGPMRLGLDFRGGTEHSNKSATSSAGGINTTGLDNVLLGVRGSFHTHFSWLNPYVQMSAGYARSNATLPLCETITGPTISCNDGPVAMPSPRLNDNFLMYEGFAGLQVPILPMLDLRPVELGIGNMNRVGGAGMIDGPSSIGVRSIGASVVFHLPSK